MGKEENPCLAAFSPFPTMFSKGLLLGIVNSRHCLVIGSFLIKRQQKITCIYNPIFMHYVTGKFTIGPYSVFSRGFIHPMFTLPTGAAYR